MNLPAILSMRPIAGQAVPKTDAVSRCAVAAVLAAACGIAPAAHASFDAPRIEAARFIALDAAVAASTTLVFADLVADDAARIPDGVTPATIVLPVAIGGIVDAARSARVPAPASRVPEPGTLALVFAGLAVVVWRVRRQRGR